MTVELNCPKCEQLLEFPSEAAGHQVRCPHCGTTLSVPTPHDFLWPPGAAPPPPPKPVAPAKPAAPARQAPPAKPAGAIPANVPRATPQRLSNPTPPADVPRARAQRVSLSGEFVPVPSSASAGAPAPAQAAPVASPVSDTASDTSTAESFDDLLNTDQWSPKKPLAAPAEATAAKLGGKGVRAPHEDERRYVDLRDVLSRAWKLYKANLGVLVGTVVLMGLTTGALQWVIGYAAEHFGWHLQDVVVGVQSSVPPLFRKWSVILLVLYLPILLSLPITLGGMSVIATVARNRRATFEDAVVGGSPMMAALIVWMICFLPHSLLTVLCVEQQVSPVWTVTLCGWTMFLVSYLVWFPSLLFISDNCGPFEAIVGSLRFWVQNVFALSVLAIGSVALLIVSLLPLGLGLPLAMPFVLLVFAVAYARTHPRVA